LSSLFESEGTDPGTVPESDPVSRRDRRGTVASALPYGMVALFLVLLVSLFGERLLPAREVSVETVMVVRVEADASGASQTSEPVAEEKGRGGEPAADPWQGETIFQASGWIEPDPLPIKATALVDGVVDRVEVLEGEAVEAGQLLATLIDDDARLDLRAAESEVALVRAQAAAHRREIETAEAGRGTWRHRLLAAEAKREEFADHARRYEALERGSVSEAEVARARLQLATQEAEVAALAAEEAEWEGRLARLEEVAGEFEARLAAAEVEAERRALALLRTRIEAPVEGTVLRLLVTPGEKRRLDMDDSHSATIAILYQPERLQARIDVPLDEASKLAIGQAVRLRSSLLPERVFRGKVTRIAGEADLQRNTLQAKVRLLDPDPRLRPEMLCRAEFLAWTEDEGAVAGESRPRGDGGAPSRRPGAGIAIFVRESALPAGAREGARGGESAEVWSLDASGRRLELRSVLLGAERREGFRLVREGLRPGDRVVVDPPADLKPGQRVRPLFAAAPGRLGSPSKP